MLDDIKLNTLAATRLMGWNDTFPPTLYWYADNLNVGAKSSWQPATNLSQAFKALDALALDWKLEPHRIEIYEPVPQDDGPMYYEPKVYKIDIGDDNMAEAIVRACLLAKGVTV